MDFDEVYRRIIDLKSIFNSERKGINGTLLSLPLLYSINKCKPSIYKGVAPCQETIRYNAKLHEVALLNNKEIVLHSADPLSKNQKFEFVRVTVKDENTLILNWDNNSYVERHLLGATHRLGVALTLGGNPLYAALAPMRFNPMINKYFLAGWIEKKGIKMTNCFTQELLIPIDSDIVIEGYIQKNEESVNGGALFHASALSQRKALLSPTPASKIDLEKLYLASLQVFVSEDIVSITLPSKDNESSCVAITINKYSEPQKEQLLHSLWGSMELSTYNEITLIDNLTGASSSHKR